MAIGGVALWANQGQLLESGCHQGMTIIRSEEPLENAIVLNETNLQARVPMFFEALENAHSDGSATMDDCAAIDDAVAYLSAASAQWQWNHVEFRNAMFEISVDAR